MRKNNYYPPRRRIRLPRSAYDGPDLTAMVTIGTRDRKPVFADHEFTTACVEKLRRTAAERNVTVLAYCFMPDHVHSVLRLDGDGNLIDVMRVFKGRTSRIAEDFGIPRNFWQASFYDHLVRPEEEPLKYVRYVLENPLRTELVQQIDAYPFVGTFEYAVDSLEDLFW